MEENDMTKITVLNDGPVLVEGDFALHDATGKLFEVSGCTTIALCRCGHSDKKPFCDGAHKKNALHSEVKA
jgi:CDGSH-type Zn-finger protein